MYNNIYTDIRNLRKPPRISPGGLCKILFAKIQDVETWPVIDTTAGVILSPISIKPGATLFVIEATEKNKTFTEASKSEKAGEYMEMQITTSLAGNSIATTLSLAAMLGQQFVMIITDKDGDQRLIGNEDAGAIMSFGYTSGDTGSSRYRNLVWKYNHPLPAPVYMGGTAVMDTPNYIFTALKLVARFRVGAVGAPMINGDSVYTNPMLANSNFIFLADGKAIHQVGDDPEERYSAKDFASSSITVNGGVTTGEVIEIYKF